MENSETCRMDEIGIAYDWAMPQDWFTDVLDRVGVNPSGHIVWRYAEPDKRFGKPWAIDMIGHIILRIYNLDVNAKGLWTKRQVKETRE